MKRPPRQANRNASSLVYSSLAFSLVLNALVLLPGQFAYGLYDSKAGVKTGFQKEASSLSLLGVRTEHPKEGETISHVSLLRMARGKDVKLEISHSGYYVPAPASGGKSDLNRLWQNGDQSVTILPFDTGAHMASTVVIVCEQGATGATKIITDFDERVIAACALGKHPVVKGYVSVTQIQGRILKVVVFQRKLTAATAEVELLPGGRVKIRSFRTIGRSSGHSSGQSLGPS